MQILDDFKKRLISADSTEFVKLSMELFHLQSVHNKVYRRYLDLLDVNSDEIKNIENIPYLPVELFRTFKVKTGAIPDEKVFESSSTTNQVPSKHHVPDLKLYDLSLLNGFRAFFGDPKNYVMLALMPSPDESPNSSLIYMVNRLMREGQHEANGFYLDRPKQLLKSIHSLNGAKAILFGLTYALLDMAESNPINLKDHIIIETGGMKGKRKELTRIDLHNTLKSAFNQDAIYSEYGMTELLSQAYSKRAGIFKPSPWMQVMIRDINDPFSIIGNVMNPSESQVGGINIIDLANIYSCAFICTSDLGKMHADGTIEVLGRMDYSDLRGCNLMMA